MPTFHIQLTGNANGPNGTQIQVPPRIALQQRGPVIPVTVGLEQGMVQSLAQRGAPVPLTRSGLALVDTGASISCIDEQLAQELHLPVVDVCQMVSASHSAHPSNVYPIQIALPQGVSFGAPRAMGANLAVQGLLRLSGETFSRIAPLFYNGNAGQITLSL